MKLFKHDKEHVENLPEAIVNVILDRDEQLVTLEKIYDTLPSGLSDCFKGSIIRRTNSKAHIEIDITYLVDLGANIFPGDIIIKNNREPKGGDIFLGILYQEKKYSTHIARIKKLHEDNQTFTFEATHNSDSVGNGHLFSIISIIEKVVKLGSTEWKKLVKSFNISYDLNELETQIKKDIDSLEHVTFPEREPLLKNLKAQLKKIKEK